MSTRYRQEVLNVVLAELLGERGAVVAPETIHYVGKERHMPDVIVKFQGLRIAIEGEIEAPKAQEKAIESASKRVEVGLTHIGIGVVYPSYLRTAKDLKTELAKAALDIAVVTESKTTDFATGNVDNLERILRSTFEQLIQEDVVAEAVVLLDVAVDRFAGASLNDKGNWGRISKILHGLSDAEVDELDSDQRAANCRIGGLVLINAMIFHDILSRHQTSVTPLRMLQGNFDLFVNQWKYVLEDINYYAIFALAREILLSLSRSTWGMPEALIEMIDTAAKISDKRAALRHDLMGRVYHRLLTEKQAKYLGTYYTSIPAATMLLKLALDPKGWTVDWKNPDEVKNIRVADLSCGTGTLLMAAADALVDNHISAAANAGEKVQLEQIHHAIAESTLFGYDVLASAIHLTASTLAMRTPDIPLKRMNLFSLPYGGPEMKLGSVEFLRGRTTQKAWDLFGAVSKAQQISGASMFEVENAILPDLDLCVMNPPFVSSRHSNMLFGSVVDANRTAMQKKLRNLVRETQIQANITAGLGSVFVAVGDSIITPKK